MEKEDKLIIVVGDYSEKKYGFLKKPLAVIYPESLSISEEKKIIEKRLDEINKCRITDDNDIESIENIVFACENVKGEILEYGKDRNQSGTLLCYFVPVNKDNMKSMIPKIVPQIYFNTNMSPNCLDICEKIFPPKGKSYIVDIGEGNEKKFCSEELKLIKHYAEKYGLESCKYKEFASAVYEASKYISKLRRSANEPLKGSILFPLNLFIDYASKLTVGCKKKLKEIVEDILSYLERNSQPYIKKRDVEDDNICREIKDMFKRLGKGDNSFIPPYKINFEGLNNFFNSSHKNNPNITSHSDHLGPNNILD